MPTAFVTGATGFLGLNLVDVLLECGWQVLALHRQSSDISLLDKRACDKAVGDLGDAKSLKGLIPEGTDCVFHVAGDTVPWRGLKDRQWRTNVTGTNNMIEAALKAKVGRFIHTSTIAIFGHHENQVTEATPKLGGNSWVGYVKSKYVAEMAVLAAAQKDLDAVVLNPGHILGAYDTSNWARLFVLTQQNALPGVPPGSGCFSNAREVAKAHIKAYEVGKRGENYLLGGPKASFLEVVTQISGFLGKESPKKATPEVLLQVAAKIGDFLSIFTRKQPKITPEVAYFVCHDENINSAKAIAELDYREIPLDISLKETYDWLLAAGQLEKSA